MANIFDLKNDDVRHKIGPPPGYHACTDVAKTCTEVAKTKKARQVSSPRFGANYVSSYFSFGTPAVCTADERAGSIKVLVSVSFGMSAFCLVITGLVKWGWA
jgi:hypothetical protein